MRSRAISLSDYNRTDTIILPINPAEIEVIEANKHQRVDLIDAGEINLIGPRGLSGIVLSSFFPAPTSPHYKLADRTPQAYVSILRRWSASREPVRLIIGDLGVNLAMLIDQLSCLQREGDKDIYYTLTLSEYRILNVPSARESPGLSAARPGDQSVPKTHIVVSGDTLWGIAKRYYGDGAQYTKIYQSNKPTIGDDPNRIYPGWELTIP